MNAHFDENKINDIKTGKVNDVKTGVYIDPNTDKERTFYYKTTLGTKDKMRFVTNVSSLVVGTNYYTFLRDLIFDFEIIDIFTDIDISGISDSPDSIIEMENIVNNTKIVDIVKSNLDKTILNELSDAVDSNIEFLTGVHRNSLDVGISNLIRIVEEKIKNIDTDTMMQFANVFNSIEGEITADKIVNAYAKSPAFLEELAARDARINNEETR